MDQRGEPAPAIATALRQYPHLAQALGPGWVIKHEPIDPVWEDHPLARWLRSDGPIAADILATLDGALGRLADVPNIADRRTRLRSHPQGLRDTMAELYFAAWLRDRGYAFRWPEKGADFGFALGGGIWYPLEVTVPHRTEGVDELYERLTWVGRRTGFRGRLEYEEERAPEMTTPMPSRWSCRRR